MSLATNMAVADALSAAGTGLFRTMPEVDERGERHLRRTASVARRRRRLHPRHGDRAVLDLAEAVVLSG